MAAAAAAAAAALPSYLASPMGMGMARAGHKSYAPVVLSSSVRSLPCKRAVRVRCQAEDNQTPIEQPAAASPSPVAPPRPTQTPPPPPKPKVSTKFSDVLAFSGPAPERINGRLAMIGFVAAMGAELVRGDDLAAQLGNGGLPWFIATAAVFSAASLIPLFKGVSVQSKSRGLMTADAELWNGRFAMLGLVALAFTEYVKGGPIV